VNDVFSSAERRHLEEPDRPCEECGERERTAPDGLCDDCFEPACARHGEPGCGPCADDDFDYRGNDA
jgi:hypothetical protein